MTRAWIAIFLIALGIATVKAMPAAQQIIIFGGQSSANNPSAPSGSALLINGIDAALLINGTDPACLAGGC